MSHPRCSFDVYRRIHDPRRMRHPRPVRHLCCKCADKRELETGDERDCDTDPVRHEKPALQVTDFRP